MSHRAEPGHSFLDVLERLMTGKDQGNYWIRPVNHTGTGFGYHIDGDRLVWMTNSITSMPSISVLFDAWEIVPLSLIGEEQKGRAS